MPYILEAVQDFTLDKPIYVCYDSIVNIFSFALRGSCMRYLSDETMRRLIAFVDEYYNENSYSPTIVVISRNLSLAVGTVHKYLHRMNEMNILRFDGRHIITPYIEELQGRFHAPVSGDISCGTPVYAGELYGEEFPLPSDYIQNGEYFWLRAKGKSMINAGIHDGDLVLIRKQNSADEGDIVAALIEDSATLKTYTIDRKNRKIVLLSENDDKENYPNQVYDSIIIQGVAEHVLKEL